MKLSIFFLYVLRVAEQENISLDEALDYAVKLGYTGIDIDQEEIKKYPDTLAKIKQHGLTVCNVYGEYDLLNGKQADAFALIDYAVESGAKVAMLLPGLFDKAKITDEMKTSPQAMKKFLTTNEKAQRALSAIKKTVEYAKQKGVYLTIESFGNTHSLTSYISQIEWLLSQVEGLKFTFDIGNFYLNGQDIFLAYDKFAKKSVHVHCKDYLTSLRVGEQDFSYAKISVPVGSGAAPTQEIAERFLDNGYDGDFTGEYLGVEGSAEVMKQSAEYFKGMFEKRR